MEAGLSLAPLSLSMFAVALLAGRKAGNRSPSKIILAGFVLLSAGVVVLIPNTLSPIEEERVLSPAEQQRVSKGLEENAEVMTNTHLEELLVGQPADVKAEIIHINTEARPRALQIALLVPLVAALLGLVNGFRMTRLPDPEASAAAEAVLGG